MGVFYFGKSAENCYICGMKNIKIRKDGIEFLIVNDIMDNDGWRYLFCRKTPKNRFIGYFTPWRMMKQAYGNSAGYMEYFNFDDVKKILGRINTWEDFLEWKAEQKARNDMHRDRDNERWNSLRQK